VAAEFHSRRTNLSRRAGRDFTCTSRHIRLCRDCSVTAFLRDQPIALPPLSLSLPVSLYVPSRRLLRVSRILVSTVTQLPFTYYRMQFIASTSGEPRSRRPPSPPRSDARLARGALRDARRRSSKLKSFKRIRRERETRAGEHGAGGPLPGISNSARFQSASVFRGGNPARTRTRSERDVVPGKSSDRFFARIR